MSETEVGMAPVPLIIKVKGGKRTVIRFFLVSVAYTSVWIAVSSQLDYFKSLYGPEILLQLNIAYYLPTSGCGVFLVVVAGVGSLDCGLAGRQAVCVCAAGV